MSEPTPAPYSGQITSEQRKELLAQRVAQEVRRGRRVETHTDYQAVVVKGKRVNHVLHLILTVLTVGTWGLVWIALAIVGGEKRKVITVDQVGKIKAR